MKKAVILTAQGVEDAEFIYPFYRLQEAGFQVEIATRDKQPVVAKHGLPIQPTMDINDLSEADFEMAVIPGGYEAPDRLRQMKPVLKFVRDMNAKGKIITSICHGPWVLISAGIVKGRKMTCYAGCVDDLKNAGADFVEGPVAVDRNIITSPHFRDNAAWMKETLRVYEALTACA